MRLSSCRTALVACLAFLFLAQPASATERRRDAALQNLKHIIVVMQENHSFDNYFGALAYVPGGVYHPVDRDDRDGDHDGDRDDHNAGCRADDHTCVDGLTCKAAHDGTLRCSNSNVDADDGGRKVFAFHDTNRCVKPD